MDYGRRIAVGDIHGCIKTLKTLLFTKLRVQKEDRLYFLGDYIDRGPDSKGVLDLLLSMKDDGYNINAIRGNHEEMAMEYLEHFSNNWIFNGGDATLKSFDVRHPKHIDPKYIDFIKSMPYFVELEDFIIAHAGINCNLSEPLKDVQSMLWTRDDYVNLERTGNRRVIAGHTPHRIEDIRNSLNKPKIQLDGGCVYRKKMPEFGLLCALDLDKIELFAQMNIEKLK